MECENDIASTLTAEETTMDAEVPNNKKTKLSSNDDTKMDCEDDTLNISESFKEIFEESKQKGWLHMNTLEPEKLKWMEDLSERKKDEPAPNEEYNARFDFNGKYIMCINLFYCNIIFIFYFYYSFFIFFRSFITI